MVAEVGPEIVMPLEFKATAPMSRYASTGSPPAGRVVIYQAGGPVTHENRKVVPCHVR